MTETPWRYCIDTSALVHGWIRAYPPDVLQPFWDRMDALIEEQILVAPMDVLVELEKKEGDDLHLWCKKRSHMFIEINEYQDELKDIMAKYPRLVDTTKGKSGADPMVIALANWGFPLYCVVTEEKGGSETKPKMPYVCDQEDIRCINLLQLIRDHGWSF